MRMIPSERSGAALRSVSASATWTPDCMYGWVSRPVRRWSRLPADGQPDAIGDVVNTAAQAGGGSADGRGAGG